MKIEPYSEAKHGAASTCGQCGKEGRPAAIAGFWPDGEHRFLCFNCLAVFYSHVHSVIHKAIDQHMTGLLAVPASLVRGGA